MDIRYAIEVFNSFAWVGGNLLLGYATVTLVVFLIFYLIWFDPRATTGGKLIFRFMTSLVLVLVVVAIGIYLDPPEGREWYIWNSDTVGSWRPILRLGAYGFVSYTITSLFHLLILRKWFPDKVKKASDRDFIKPRHTNEIPIIRKKF